MQETLENVHCLSFILFLANIGGLMGLCLGFSLLSVVELIYFFTLRWCVLCCRRKGGCEGERFPILPESQVEFVFKYLSYSRVLCHFFFTVQFCHGRTRSRAPTPSSPTSWWCCTWSCGPCPSCPSSFSSSTGSTEKLAPRQVGNKFHPPSCEKVISNPRWAGGGYRPMWGVRRRALRGRDRGGGRGRGGGGGLEHCGPSENGDEECLLDAGGAFNSIFQMSAPKPLSTIGIWSQICQINIPNNIGNLSKLKHVLGISKAKDSFESGNRYWMVF